MLRRRQALLLIFLLSILMVIYISFPVFFKESNQNALQAQSDSHMFDIPRSTSKQVLTIAVVACGQRLQDTLMMIKSALLFNQPKDFLHFIVFAEDSLMTQFQEKLDDWTALLRKEFSFEIRPLEFPKLLEKEWRQLFKPCASQRLFLPSLLRSVDSLLYVDTDILFLSPVSDIWRFFSKFNETQIAAVAPEHENENAGWYNRFARHPYYGKLGVNSGVMLMNLTRMRSFDWETKVHAIYADYKLKLTWGDQDIINIIFYFHPEKLYLLNCSYNYRPDHCMYAYVCDVSTGIKIMHGNRGYFQSKKQPLFRSIYEAVERYQLDSDPYNEFLIPLEVALKDPSVVASKCGEVAESSMKIASQLFLGDNIYNMNQLAADVKS